MNPDLQRVDPPAVADHAVDHHPAPAIAHGDLGQSVAQNAHAHRAARIDHQHTAVAGLLKRAEYRAVILECDKRRAGTEATQRFPKLTQW